MMKNHDVFVLSRLVKQGHTVIGVELIRKAIEDFFTENSVPYSREAINMAPNGAYVYTVSFVKF